MYYKFDVAGATVQNLASSPVGTNPAPVLGLTQGSTGQFGLALVGKSGASSTNMVNTGWATSLPNTGWTISMWLNAQPVNTSLYYLWGDPGAASFRCFIGGAAGAGNLLLRGGGLSDVVVTGAGPGPTVVHFVYTGTAIRVYKNGVFVNQVTQPTVTVSGAGPFKVGGYSTSTGMLLNSLLDEFRMYNRPLSDTEISMTWNQSLPMLGTLTGTVTSCFTGLPIAGATVSIPPSWSTTTLANGTYSMPAPAGTWNVNFSAPTFLTKSLPATIVATQTTTLNACLDPMPGILDGIVTNASTGNPIIGAKISVNNPPYNSTVYSVSGGAYALNVFPLGTFAVTCQKLGYEDYPVGTLTFQQGVTQTINIPMLESTNPPYDPMAMLNTAETAVDISWGIPVGDYEILYDDGIAENFTVWAVGGNQNAVKFTPVSYPATVFGGKVNIGTIDDYPSGSNPLVPFKIAVYDDDGAGGLPGTAIDTMDVIPTAFGWVEFTMPGVTITSGSFYLVMIQGGNAPDAAGIAIDQTSPQLRSYARFVTGGGPWIPADGNFMMRANVNGAGGPLLLDASGAQIPEEPMGTENTDVITAYQVWRLLQGEEGNQAVWTSMGDSRHPPLSWTTAGLHYPVIPIAGQ